MTKSDEMSDLVHRHGLQIEAPLFARRRRGPREDGVEEDIRFDNLGRQDVDHEGRGAEHAIEVGLLVESEHGNPIVVKRHRAREAGELKCDRGRGHRLPGGEGARHRRLKLRGRDARSATIGEPANSRRIPLSGVGVEHERQVEVGLRRLRAEDSRIASNARICALIVPPQLRGRSVRIPQAPSGVWRDRPRPDPAPPPPSAA